MALIGTLTSGVSALKVFSKDLEVIGNNIANVNTVAFKSSSVSISNDFSNTLKVSQPGIAGQQIGTGTKISGISTNFTQGSLTGTGVDTDLGISGEGYFLVKDPNSNSVYATRAGNFHWDDNGFLVTENGLRVQGLTGSSTTAPTTATGDIQKDPLDLASGASLKSVSIDTSGSVVQYYSDGQSKTVGQILLQKFNQPGALMSQGDGLYSALTNAGPIAPNNSNAIFTSGITATDAKDYQAGISGNGTVEAKKLEASNVDLTDQFSKMISAQRSFQAASRIVTVSDTLLEDIVNLKR